MSKPRSNVLDNGACCKCDTGDLGFYDYKNAIQERADMDSGLKNVDSQTTYGEISHYKNASNLHSCLCTCSRIKQPSKSCTTARQSTQRRQSTQNKRLAKGSVQAAIGVFASRRILTSRLEAPPVAEFKVSRRSPQSADHCHTTSDRSGAYSCGRSHAGVSQHRGGTH